VSTKSVRFDPRNMTIRDLCALVDQLRTTEPDSPAHRRAIDRMCMASWYLEHSGVLWCMGLDHQTPPGFELEPEPPSEGRMATVLEMPLR
jgi:hypothetical protein